MGEIMDLKHLIRDLMQKQVKKHTEKDKILCGMATQFATLQDNPETPENTETLELLHAQLLSLEIEATEITVLREQLKERDREIKLLDVENRRKFRKKETAHKECED